MNVKTLCGVFLVAGAVSMLAVDCAYAQRGGRMGGMMGRMGGDSSMNLLNDEKVQQELELVDGQIEELKEIQREAGEAMRDVFSEIQDMPRDQQREAWGGLREKMEERMKGVQKRVDEVLLPHQRSRLKQLTYQAEAGRGQSRSAGGALGNSELLEELGVTDEQKKELEEAIEKAKKELAKKYARLVASAEEDVLKVLDSKQRKKYRELVGETFQFEERNNRGRQGQRQERERRGNRSDF